MEIQPDFKELLALFNAHGVEYLVVGGYALAFHGAPRYTGDMDLLVRPVPANAQRIMKALGEFGFGDAGLDASDFHRPGQVVQLGVPPVRVDIITSLDGVSWDEAEQGKVVGAYGDLVVSYIGREAFIANKRAVGRHKDLADIESLEDPS